MTRYVLATALALALPFAAAHADRDRPPPHRPPQAAIDACASKTAGTACTVELDGHSIAGTCAAPPDSATLACRPDHPDHPHGPPPEAIEACASKTEGTACTVAHGDHAVNGTCAHGPDGNGPLACKPEGGPPPR
jgi:hypothetical protein